MLEISIDAPLAEMPTHLFLSLAFSLPRITAKTRCRSWKALVALCNLPPTDNESMYQLCVKIARQYGNLSPGNDVANCFQTLLYWHAVHDLTGGFETSILSRTTLAAKCLYAYWTELISKHSRPVVISERIRSSGPIPQQSLHPYSHLPTQIIHWNLKTLQQLKSPLSKAKAKLIKEWLEAKSIVCINEHHWRAGDEEHAMQLLQAHILASHDIDHHGHPKGGVAILIDRSLQPCIIQKRILIPGYAIGIIIQGCMPAAPPWDAPFLLICAYIRPDIKQALLCGLADALNEWFAIQHDVLTLPTLLLGDMNFQSPVSAAFCPDSINAQECLEGLLDVIQANELFLPQESYTWQRKWRSHQQQKGCIDRAFTTHRQSITFQALPHRNLSDHTPLLIKMNKQKSDKSKHSHPLRSALKQAIPPSALRTSGPLVQLLRIQLSDRLGGISEELRQAQSLPVDFSDQLRVDELLSQFNALQSAPPLKDPWRILWQAGSVAREWWCLVILSKASKPCCIWREFLRCIRMYEEQINALQQSQQPNTTSDVKLSIHEAQVIATMQRMADSPCDDTNSVEGLRKIAASKALRMESNTIDKAQALEEWSFQWTSLRKDTITPPDYAGAISRGKPKEAPASQKLARRMFPKLVASPAITNEDGSPFTSESDTEAALRASREQLWTTIDQIDMPLLNAWMDAYKKDRIGEFSLQAEIPGIPQIIAILLRAGPSASGIDGLPYELWQLCPLGVATCLYHTFKLLRDHPMQCTIQFLESMDVVVFIPKAAGATAASAQRPLAIPTTLLRLFSAAGMSTIAPVWSPKLHQAATALPGKGDCAANVRTLQAFVSWYNTQPAYAQTTFTGKITELLPPVVLELFSLLSPFLKGLDIIRTLAFVDQVKAYEVIGYPWLTACWTAWNMHKWIWQWLFIVTLNRTARIKVGSHFGPKLVLVKGLGMGGPHAPLQWSVGFDPIVWMLDVVVGTHLTTVFADDTALANSNSEALLRGQLLLAVSGLVAGLRIAYHNCVNSIVTVPIALFMQHTQATQWNNASWNIFTRKIATAAQTIPFVEISVEHTAGCEVFRAHITGPSPVVNLLSWAAIYSQSIVETNPGQDQPLLQLLHHTVYEFTRATPCKCACKCDLLLSPLTASLIPTTAMNAHELLGRTLDHALEQAKLPPPHIGTMIRACSDKYRSQAPTGTLAWLSAYHSGRAALSEGTDDHIQAKIEGDFTVWGGAAIVDTARYLGPSVSIPLTGNKNYLHATAKPIRKMWTRTFTLNATRTSFAGASYIWNMHILSCVPHIWSAIYITEPLLRPIYKIAAAALRTGRWTNIKQLFAARYALGIMNFPSSPWAIAQAAFCAGVLKDRNSEFPSNLIASSTQEMVNPLGLRANDVCIATRILLDSMAPLHSPASMEQCHPTICTFIKERHEYLCNKLKQSWAQRNNGQANVKRIRRALTELLGLKEGLQDKGGLSLLIQRSKQRTFSPTDGLEWMQLAKIARDLPINVAYDFYRAWLNGIWDERRARFVNSLSRHAVGLMPAMCQICHRADFKQTSTGKFLPYGWKHGGTLCQPCAEMLSHGGPPKNKQLETKCQPLWLRIQATPLATDLLAPFQPLLEECNHITSHHLFNPLKKHFMEVMQQLRVCENENESNVDRDIEDQINQKGCRLCLAGENSTEHLMWWCPVVMLSISAICNHIVDPLHYNPLLLQGDYLNYGAEIGFLWRTILLVVARRRRLSSRQLIRGYDTPLNNLITILEEWWQSLPAKLRPHKMPPLVAALTARAIMTKRLAKNDKDGIHKCQHVLMATTSAIAQVQAARPTNEDGPRLSHLQAEGTTILVATRDAALDDMLAVTCTTVNPIGWPLYGHASQPIFQIPVVQDEGSQPNARIMQTHCLCGASLIQLVATAYIRAGQLIHVTLCASLHIIRPTEAYISIMYDGSCPVPRTQAPYAGTGAVIILHLPGGTHRILATLALALPGVGNAQIAEAMGARLAFRICVVHGLSLLRQYQGTYICIRGDSRVITMDYNSYGTIKTPLMSQVLLPLKAWGARCPWLRGVFHVPRAYNSLADAAANRAAKQTLARISAPYLTILQVDVHDITTFASEQLANLQQAIGQAHAYTATIPLLPAPTDRQAQLLLKITSLISIIHAITKAVPDTTFTNSLQHSCKLHMLATELQVTASFFQYLIKSSIADIDAAQTWLTFLAAYTSTTIAIEQAQAREQADIANATQPAICMPYAIQKGHSHQPVAMRPLGLPLSAGDLDPTALSILHQQNPSAAVYCTLPVSFLLLAAHSDPRSFQNMWHLLQEADNLAHTLQVPFKTQAWHLKQALRGANATFHAHGHQTYVALINQIARLSQQLLVTTRPQIEQTISGSRGIDLKSVKLATPSNLMLAAELHAITTEIVLLSSHAKFVIGAYAVCEDLSLLDLIGIGLASLIARISLLSKVATAVMALKKLLTFSQDPQHNYEREPARRSVFWRINCQTHAAQNHSTLWQDDDAEQKSLRKKLERIMTNIERNISSHAKQVVNWPAPHKFLINNKRASSYLGSDATNKSQGPSKRRRS